MSEQRMVSVELLSALRKFFEEDEDYRRDSEQFLHGKLLDLINGPGVEPVAIHQWRKRPQSDAVNNPWFDDTKGECYSRIDQYYEARTLYLAAPSAPKINIKCETPDEYLVGHSSLRVIRVEQEDGGSFTAVTDYWPSAPSAPVRAVPDTDAMRYRKLRRWMSSNVAEGWEQVKKLAAIACYVDWDAFDMSLDELPECNVGLCYTRPVTPQPPKEAGE